MEDFAKQLKVQSLGMFENIVSGSDPARVYASAGNQGLSFALAPASWQGVNAVGACIQTAPPSKRAAFSNAALQLLGDYTVREGYYAPGGWFEHPAFGPTKGYWGSSFSAPHVAVLDALGSLSERSPGCFTVY